MALRDHLFSAFVEDPSKTTHSSFPRSSGYQKQSSTFVFPSYSAFCLTIRGWISHLSAVLPGCWNQDVITDSKAVKPAPLPWHKRSLKKIKKKRIFFKINRVRKPWKSQPPATRDFNKHSELVSMTLRLYLSEGTKCQSGFSLLEEGTQVSMETRRRWRCLWRGFLHRFPSWQFTFAEDINKSVVLEKIKNVLASLDCRPWHCRPLYPLASVKELYPLTAFTYLPPYYTWLNYWWRWKINLMSFPP